MENKVGAAESPRTYEDFEPFCKWPRRDVVEVHLQGFRKDYLKVQIINQGILTIHGERPLNENKSNTWSRFHKEIKLADKCDPNEVRAKLAGGVLTVTMPHKVSNVIDPNNPKATTTAATTPKEKDVPADHHQDCNNEKQIQAAATTTTNYDQANYNPKSSLKDDVKPTSCEFRGQRRSSTTLVSRLKVGKDVAVKLAVAVAVLVAFGFGAYVVNYHKHCHPYVY